MGYIKKISVLNILIADYKIQKQNMMTTEKPEAVV